MRVSEHHTILLMRFWASIATAHVPVLRLISLLLSKLRCSAELPYPLMVMECRQLILPCVSAHVKAALPAELPSTKSGGSNDGY